MIRPVIQPRAVHMAILVVLTGAVSACGADNGLASAFDGEWTGSWNTADPGPSGALQLNLDQAGTNVTGTATFDGHACFLVCNVACQANGVQISGHFDAGAFQVAFDASCPGPHYGGGAHHGGGANHDTLRGTYEILGGLCAGEYGTVELTSVPTSVAEPRAPEFRPVGEVILIGLDDGELVQLPLIERTEEGR